MKTGIQLIAEERQRQINVEGWSAQHDDEHTNQELAIAAGCYAFPEGHVYTARENMWPITWDKVWFKPTSQLGVPGRVKELVKAGALVAAEIDRLNRTAPNKVEVWIEGYRATGEHGIAQLLHTTNVNSFAEAVIDMHFNTQHKVDRNHIDANGNTTYYIWGCRLFDNEADARKSFG